MNNIFEKILNSKINSFVEDFTVNSKSFFVDKNGKLIHPRRIWNF